MARDFNGTTDRIDWANIDNLKGDALTISYWVYLDAVAHNSYVICQHDASNTVLGIVAGVPSTTALTFIRHRTDGGDFVWQAGSLSNLTGAWHHVLITSNGALLEGSVVIYLDGTSKTLTLTGSGTESEHTGSWALGGRIYDDNRNFDGKIGEVAVWGRVLSSTEIAQLAAGYYPGYVSTDLLFYWSGDNNSLEATPGGTGTADGTSDYTTSYPAITYPAALAGRAAITATGTVTSGTAHSAESTITGQAAIIATGTKAGAQLGQANLSAQAAIIATGRVTKNAQASLSGRATITATGTVTEYYQVDDLILEWQEVAAALAGRATITATALKTAQGQASPAGRATITATGLVIKNALATINARASIIATGTVTTSGGGTAHSVTSTITASAALTATGQVAVYAQSVLAGTAAIIATGQVIVNSALTISGVGTLTGTGTVTTSTTAHSAAADIICQSSVVPSGLVTVYGMILIWATANLSGTPPSKGTGTRTVWTVGARATLYMPTRKDVIIDN
jgi:hypothetical protein